MMNDSNSAENSVSLTLDVFRGDTLSGARRWADLHPSERRRRAVVAAQQHDAGELWDLTEAYTYLYGSAGGSMSPRTARAYREGVRRFVTYAQAHAVNLTRPERDTGPVYARTLEVQGLKPSSVRVQLAAARALYRALRWAGASESDPFSDTHPAPDKVAPWDKRSPYSDAQVRALLDHAPQRDRVLILLCAHGGLRISEALALTWGSVTSDALTVERGKGGKRRRVALSGTLAAALAELRAEQSTGAAVSDLNQVPVIGGTPEAARKRLAVIARRAGVEVKGFHAFRHYAGTRLAAALSLEDAARHLGHASIETTRVYAKWSDTALSDALKEW